MAANTNIVVLAGNLTRDPEIRYTPSGSALAQLSLANGRKFRDSKTNEWREETSFIDVEFWGKQAETAKQYLTKGTPILVEGRLQQDRWEDKNTGQKRSKLKVVGIRFNFLGGKSQGGSQGGNYGGDSGSEPEPQEPDLGMPEDDIPF